METCISCNKKIKDSVKLPCPNCGKEIRRCNRCRGLSIEFKCQCGHKGP